MKKLIIAIGILIVCGLENIGHYFGFCFHGWTATILGSLGVFGIGLYSNSAIVWLNMKRKGDHSHKCDHEQNHVEETITPDAYCKNHLGGKVVK